MSPILLRQLWMLIETSQPPMLLSLDDTALVQWLMWQLNSQRLLNTEETNLFSSYIQSRLPLIRDMAHNRLAV